MRLLLIEDDPMIGRAVQDGLSRAGFTVDWATDGSSGEAAIGNAVYDAVLLDLGLPRVDGLSLLRRLRGRRDNVPVLIISARDAVSERVSGLNAGADDYLLKPFDLDELVARVRALLRRHAGSAASVMTAGPLSLDPTQRIATLDGQELTLTGKEFALLRDELHTSVADLRSEVHGEISRSAQRTVMWMTSLIVPGFIALFAAIIARG